MSIRVCYIYTRRFSKLNPCMFQVSQVYQTMKITTLSKMIPFSDFAVVEKLSVDAVKYSFLQLNIDHLKGIVQFGSQVKKFNFLGFIILNVSVHGVFLRVRKLLGVFICVGPQVIQDLKSFKYSCEALKQG